MSTCATIRFVDERDTAFYVSRGHDGFPEIVQPDVERVLERLRERTPHVIGFLPGPRWAGSEIQLFIPFLFSVLNDPEERLPTYELLSGWRGDECYRFEMSWRGDKWRWTEPDEIKEEIGIWAALRQLDKDLGQALMERSLSELRERVVLARSFVNRFLPED